MGILYTVRSARSGTLLINNRLVMKCYGRRGSTIGKLLIVYYFSVCFLKEGENISWIHPFIMSSIKTTCVKFFIHRNYSKNAKNKEGETKIMRQREETFFSSTSSVFVFSTELHILLHFFFCKRDTLTRYGWCFWVRNLMQTFSLPKKEIRTTFLQSTNLFGPLVATTLHHQNRFEQLLWYNKLHN